MLHRATRGDLIQAQNWNEIVRRVAGLSHDPHRRLGELRLMDRGEAFWFGPIACSDYYLWMTFASPIYVAGTDGCVTPKTRNAVRVWAITRTDETGAWMDRRHMWAVQEPTSREWYTVPCCDLPDSSSPPSSPPEPGTECCPDWAEGSPTTCAPEPQCYPALYYPDAGCGTFGLRNLRIFLYACPDTNYDTDCCYWDISHLISHFTPAMHDLVCDGGTVTALRAYRHPCTYYMVGRIDYDEPFSSGQLLCRLNPTYRYVFWGGRGLRYAYRCDDGPWQCHQTYFFVNHYVDCIRLTWQCGAGTTYVQLDVHMTLASIAVVYPRLSHSVFDCSFVATYSGTFDGDWRPGLSGTYVTLPLTDITSNCMSYGLTSTCRGGPWSFANRVEIGVNRSA